MNYWKITQYFAYAIAVTAIGYGVTNKEYVYAIFGGALILAFVVAAVNKRRKMN